MAHVQKVFPRSCSRCLPREGRITHYEVRWTERAYDTSGGKRFRQETFHTRKEALARKAEVESERSLSGTVRDASVAEAPFGEVAQAWLDSMAPRVKHGKLKQRTLDDYGAVLRRYVLPVWGGVPVGAITGQRAETWAGELAARGLAAGTYRHAWAAFNRVLKYAVRHDILTANPADKVDGVGTINLEHFEGTALTAEQVAAVAEEVGRQYPVYAVTVLFLAYTGLRAAELAGLDVGDLTLHGGQGSVRVRRTRWKKKGVWHVGTPKSRTSRRTVPLDSWLAEMMASYLTDTHPNGSDPDAPLFPNRKVGGIRQRQGSRVDLSRNLDWTQPVEPGAFHETIFKPACRRAGVPPVRLHDLRHTFATMQLRAGPPDHYLQVSRWLGHTDAIMLLKVYAHVIPQPGTGKAHQLPPPPIGNSNVVQFRPRTA
ncbi:tyrosine-type recombinase/integrase [Pseudonocardia lutea]|uniref:Tyrosine-type recombinase/integrase n=1 Tax=Pseudonocardia lutea TaxID=2172015 RepID=A0ABW1I1L6_9PSEU